MRYLSPMHSDEYFMQMCIDLAKKGLGYVAPNPMVGAVIVHNQEVIGQGYHELYGGPHAEVNAVNSVSDEELLSESTIYVSLEPCAHFRKTPPCCDLLITKQFKRVVIGSEDPFSAVNGAGIDKIKSAGIDVKVGVLEEKCKELNKAFFTAHTLKRPYVTLKWAQTKSGKIDAGQSNQEVTWISSPETQKFTHKLRADNQAILVGYNTVVNDNPSLTVRAVQGKNPIRIVLDRDNSLPRTMSVFNSEAQTIVLTEKGAKENSLSSFIGQLTPSQILTELYNQNIISVLIEGGRKTLQSFIDDGLWDEAYMIIGTEDFDEGTPAPYIDKNKKISSFYIGKDLINHFRR